MVRVAVGRQAGERLGRVEQAVVVAVERALVRDAVAVSIGAGAEA